MLVKAATGVIAQLWIQGDMNSIRTVHILNKKVTYCIFQFQDVDIRIV